MRLNGTPPHYLYRKPALTPEEERLRLLERELDNLYREMEKMRRWLYLLSLAVCVLTTLLALVQR